MISRGSIDNLIFCMREQNAYAKASWENLAKADAEYCAKLSLLKWSREAVIVDAPVRIGDLRLVRAAIEVICLAFGKVIGRKMYFNATTRIS